DPETPEIALDEQRKQAEGNEKPPDHLTRSCSDACRSIHVVRDGPHDRSQHAAAVERESRNQIEDRQRDVDVGEPTENGGRTRHRGWPEGIDDTGEQPTYDADRDAGDRPRNRNQELFTRRGSVLLDLSDAAEREQRDAADRDAADPGHTRMRELVQDDADKEKESRRERQAPDNSRRPIRVDRRELTRQRQRDQPCDDEPAVMETDGNAEPAAEADARLHGNAPPRRGSEFVPGSG